MGRFCRYIGSKSFLTSSNILLMFVMGFYGLLNLLAVKIVGLLNLANTIKKRLSYATSAGRSFPPINIKYNNASLFIGGNFSR